ncbi:hypothetical protein ACHAPC_005343 [Botrytis cinerea]|uniref:Uncharacterized protein n=1 Tax=Botryotinia fuckeliana (strain T4) TaxID=999810 RepID=G2YGV5_BOTF4|nr:hypothetical protein BofuT4_P022570.1 [Botrytis cinerea T4]
MQHTAFSETGGAAILSSLSPSQSLGSASPISPFKKQRIDSGKESGPSSESIPLSIEQQLPEIILSVRLKEDLAPDLSADFFVDWLCMMLIIAESVIVEARFGSFSTLIDAAISLVGIKKGILSIKDPSYSDKECNELVNTKRGLSEAINVCNNRMQSMELQIQGRRNDLSESNREKRKLRRERDNSLRIIEDYGRMSLKGKCKTKGGADDKGLRLGRPDTGIRSEQTVVVPVNLERNDALTRLSYEEERKEPCISDPFPEDTFDIIKDRDESPVEPENQILPNQSPENLDDKHGLEEKQKLQE